PDDERTRTWLQPDEVQTRAVQDEVQDAPVTRFEQTVSFVPVDVDVMGLLGGKPRALHRDLGTYTCAHKERHTQLGDLETSKTIRVRVHSNTIGLPVAAPPTDLARVWYQTIGREVVCTASNSPRGRVVRRVWQPLPSTV